MLNGRAIINPLIAGLIKKDLIKCVSTFHHIEIMEVILKLN